MTTKQELKYDVVILGGGPAGLAASVYTGRGNLKTAIIDKNMFGGKPAEYLNIENYPGFPTINACELAEKFEEHSDNFGADKFPYTEIIKADLTGEIKKIETEDKIFKAKSVIIATGTRTKKLNIPGENEFKCRGVSYCAVCDGAFFKDKILAVIGGGNSAVEEACYLTKFASKVYIIHRRKDFRADNIILERALKNEKIEFITDSEVKEIKGTEKVEKIDVKNVKTGNISEIKVDGVFPYIGEIPNVELFSGMLKQTPCGFIETDENMQTSIAGVFAVGDVREKPLKQVVTAVSDGAVAGHSASVFIQKHLGAAVNN